VERVAVFAGAALRRNLEASQARGLVFSFFPALQRALPSSDLTGLDAAIVELRAGLSATVLRRLRAALPGRPLLGASRSITEAQLRRSKQLGLDAHLVSWGPGDPPAAEVRAAMRAARRVGPSEDARRLATLSDIVKTANSILEPRRVIDLIMTKIQVLIPCEAWSMLMVDETRRELRFEVAMGGKAQEVSGFRVRMGEGIAGWVAQSGKPVISNNVRRDRRFAPRFDSETRFETRSVLCAPLIARGRTIGVVQVINRRGGGFTRADLALLLTLVEPCAIAIENALLFQRAEQLTITDDLTGLFNSRYLGLQLGREIKRCRRHSARLSVIFLDLDGFKGINDCHGHLAGSATLAEMGKLLQGCVRESDTLARYGGDEFVVLLPETAPEGALVIAERIRRAIEAHVFLTGQGLAARLSASVGVATHPDHADTAETLIRMADQAMYYVKQRDKNGVALAAADAASPTAKDPKETSPIP
jgi:diguanylate cyclase (GGDEF)-like protein